MALVAIAVPAECMAAMQGTHAMDCCAKGKCRHGKSADDCCRDMISAGAATIASLPPASHSISPPHVLVANHVAVVSSPNPAAEQSPQASSPRGSPPHLRRSLPLLI